MMQFPPSVVNDGVPHVDVSGLPLLMFAGTAEGGKVHILMNFVVHSIATIPPPLALKEEP